MNKKVIEVQVRGIAPSTGGCAIFLGNKEKVFVFYVDHSIGNVINMLLTHTPRERPLTHDLIVLILSSLGAKVERIIINDVKNETYYCRLILSAENELQQKKIIELDARPSDCIALALQQSAPIYVSANVWDEVEDMSTVLRQIQEAADSKQEEDS